MLSIDQAVCESLYLFSYEKSHASFLATGSLCTGAGEGEYLGHPGQGGRTFLS